MMKNKKLMRALIIGAGIFALAGCGTPNDTDTNGEKQTKNSYMENDRTDPDKTDASDENNSKDTSKGNNSRDTPVGNDSKHTPAGDDSNVVGSMDGNEIIAASDLQGSVTEFSDNGCTITPTTSSNDGNDGEIAEQAAEGYEDEGTKVTVKYGENCIFQRAVMSIATGKATVSEVDKTDIKKKTSLLLYGNFDDTENFTATKVMIVQYEYEQGE